MARRPKNPIRPLEALRGIRELIRDPDDTRQVFRIIRSLAGSSLEHNFQRFLQSEAGPRILAERRSLVDRLSDREALRSLPAGSLGQAYADFTELERITPAGLVEASIDVPGQQVSPCPDRRLFNERLRDMHDLWHVVTGYGRDLVGESALLAFTYRQTQNRGIGFIVAVAHLRAGRAFSRRAPSGGRAPSGEGSPQRAMIRDGARRGRSAAWLPGADWEQLLERPLEEVRRSLRVEPVRRYESIRSAGAPAVL